MITKYETQNSTSKIIIAVIISFIIAFTFFWIFMNFANPVKVAEIDFYSQELPSDKKLVFILGSSYVGQINANIVNEFLSKNSEDYIVYNLSIHSDQPKKRLKTLDKIIPLKPDLIIYGIGFNDLGSYEEQSSPIDIQQFFQEFFSIENLVDIRQNPKDITLDFILNIITYSSFSNRDEFNPFYPQKIPVMSVIRTNEEFEKRYDDGGLLIVDHIPDFEKNENAKALQQTVKKLQENDIKLVIFTVPYNRVYFNHASDSVIEDFYDVLNLSVAQDGINIYNLQSKYADLDIWANPSHVAYNNNKTTIFPEEISEIILKELDT